MTIDDLQEKISQSWLENNSMQTCMLECVEHAVAYSNAKNDALKEVTASLRKELEEAKANRDLWHSLTIEMTDECNQERAKSAKLEAENIELLSKVEEIAKVWNSEVDNSAKLVEALINIRAVFYEDTPNSNEYDVWELSNNALAEYEGKEGGSNG